MCYSSLPPCSPPGLDARAASIVMRAVRNVARNGRTVMVTIHQPSIEIFEAFDSLLLLQVGCGCLGGAYTHGMVNPRRIRQPAAAAAAAGGLWVPGGPGRRWGAGR